MKLSQKNANLSRVSAGRTPEDLATKVLHFLTEPEGVENFRKGVRPRT